ncbi:MAG: acyl carrier protein [Candidatus Brocadia sp.]|jgi:Acyl carrier protein|nr:acyl carrier protein [Candidatus Brocadia sp.]MCE7912854.1 acyl carrier protein [Candidatus Brocadia sp. AMX3]RIJ92333.1 MAG: acyl carrier protein [Candidatus Brocadia sp.]UJS20089.1 MAG: acyl carrier protein [Candidatus Brocadia sp.]
MSGEVVSIDNRVKKVIIERLKPNINVAEISKNTPLIGKGLGLDSVGVLELVVGLEQEFSIMFDDSEMNIELFENIGSLTNYIDKKLNYK